jgi:hypothetical protein
MSKKPELGDRVKDLVTGIEGIIVSVSQNLFGCDRVYVQPKVQPDGKVPDSWWVDIDSVQIVMKQAVKGHQEMPAGAKTGGPMSKSR